MSQPAIRVQNLSKRYRIGAHDEAHDTLAGAAIDALKSPLANLRRLRRLTRFSANGQEPSDVIWALKDVSFEVQPGEVVGVIGRNGAGKSTLLKLLSRITHPTSGRIELNGRVSSLLEVGTGFHPELTGRENIFLNGTILGMSKAEIDHKFDEIVDFSGVEKFIDTPVKRYSSGMRVRLAFSVAAHLEPEILVVDEVLAVGDAKFQRKCLAKMGAVADAGRTVLFVSHNMVAVQSLCRRTIWLHDGMFLQDGKPDKVIASYLQKSASDSTITERVWPDFRSAPGNDSVRLHSLCVRPKTGTASDTITMRTPLVFEFEYWNLESGSELDVNFHLITEQEIVAFASSTINEANWHARPCPQGLFRSVCYVPGDLLNEGIHRIKLHIYRDGHELIYQQKDALRFNVLGASARRYASYSRAAGIVRPFLKWNTEFLKHDQASLD